MQLIKQNVGSPAYVLWNVVKASNCVTIKFSNIIHVELTFTGNTIFYQGDVAREFGSGPAGIGYALIFAEQLLQLSPEQRDKKVFSWRHG